MASANDMEAAKATYSSFISMLKYAVPPIMILAAFVVWLIS